MEGRSEATLPTRAPIAALLWSLRKGWGLEACSWIPRPARAGQEAQVSSGRPLRPREVDWSPLATLDPGSTWRPSRRRSPRAAAGLRDELWVAPSSSTAHGLLCAVGEAQRLPAADQALAAADRLDQLSRVTVSGKAAIGASAHDAAWAHDLRNRLTHALLGLERYRSEHEQQVTSPLDEVAESLQLAREACRGRLLGAPRTDSAGGPLRPILLRATRSAAQLAGRAASGTAAPRVLVRCPASLEVCADDALLFRAIENLTLNALQASAPGAPVRVEARVDGTVASVAVRDEGRGMGRAELEAFRTPGRSGRRAEGGTGFGTASLFECLERLGAELDLETQPGVGTVACVRLPRAGTRGGAGSITWSPWSERNLDDDLFHAIRSGSTRRIRMPRGAQGPRAAELLELCREHGVLVELVSCRSNHRAEPRRNDTLAAPARAPGFERRPAPSGSC